MYTCAKSSLFVQRAKEKRLDREILEDIYKHESIMAPCNPYSSCSCIKQATQTIRPSCLVKP